MNGDGQRGYPWQGMIEPRMYAYRDERNRAMGMPAANGLRAREPSPAHGDVRYSLLHTYDGVRGLPYPRYGLSFNRSSPSQSWSRYDRGARENYGIESTFGLKREREYATARGAHLGVASHESVEGQISRKKTRVKNVKKVKKSPDVPDLPISDKTSHMYTAYACDFLMDGVSQEERNLLPSIAKTSLYAHARNVLLNYWRSDVRQYLSEDDAIDLFGDSMKPYAMAAWHYLNSMGYINFGVSEAINDRIDAAPDDKGSVIVIGAGCAGLAAARQLRMKGYKVIVLEGRNRPGGRVHTEKMMGPKSSTGDRIVAVTDLGGSILTGIDGNPLASIVKQMQMPLSKIGSETVPIFLPDGNEADPELDGKVEKLYNKLLQDSDELRKKPGAESLSLMDALESLWQDQVHTLMLKTENERKVARQLFDWHLANLEFANASLLSESSLLHWDQDDPHELPGYHCFAPGCNGQWIDELTKGLAIFYNSVVTKIKRYSDGVRVYLDNKNVFMADAVVITVPLGVLKNNSIKFEPPLTHRKKGAIARMGFGNLNKVIMLFPEPFWNTDLDIFGHINEDQKLRGEDFMFYSYAGLSGGAQLTALCSGKAAQENEKRSVSENARRMLDLLRKIFEPKGIKVPCPLHVICTKWGSDPLAFGAYSSMPVGTLGGEDYDILGESIGNRIFFAGEATNKKFPATMHGAFYTGLWTAANVDSTLCKLSSSDQNAIGLMLRECQREIQSKRTSTPPVPRHLTPKVVAQDNAMVLLRKSKLRMIFGDPKYPPPFSYSNGAVAAIKGSIGTRFEEKCLMQLKITENGIKTEETYVIIPIHVLKVMDQRSIDLSSNSAIFGAIRDSINQDQNDIDAFSELILQERRNDPVRQELKTDWLLMQLNNTLGTPPLHRYY